MRSIQQRQGRSANQRQVTVALDNETMKISQKETACWLLVVVLSYVDDGWFLTAEHWAHSVVCILRLRGPHSNIRHNTLILSSMRTRVIHPVRA